jgi:AAA domain
MPKPILLDWDKGSDEVDVKTIPGPKDWLSSMQLIREIAADPGEFQSLAIDTADPLEDMAEAFICARDKKSSLEAYGFGSGYEALAAEWRVFLAELDQVRAKGLTVMILLHATVRTAQDPVLGDHDQWTGQLQKKTWAATLRWADMIGFMDFDSAKAPDGKRSLITEDRVLHTQRGTGFVAKNRYNMPLRIPMVKPNLWGSVQQAIQTHQLNPAEIILRIEGMAKLVEQRSPGALEKAKSYVLDAKLDVTKLLSIEQALTAKLSEPTNAQAGAGA